MTLRYEKLTGAALKAVIADLAKLRIAVFRVLFQKLVEHPTSFWGKLLEIVFALGLEPLGALAAGTQRRIEREMAKQVERISFKLTRLLGQCLTRRSILG